MGSRFNRYASEAVLKCLVLVRHRVYNRPMCAVVIFTIIDIDIVLDM